MADTPRLTVTITKANVKMRRRPRGEFQAAIKKHARHTGELMYAWNNLHSAFFDAFTLFVSPNKSAIAHAIWHTIQSDKTQREMLMRTAEAALGNEHPMFLNLKWAADRAGDLSSFRNDAAHVAMWTIHDGQSARLTPDRFTNREQAVHRLVRTPTAQVWQKVRGDLLVLAHYTRLVAMQLQWPKAMPKTFPARPPLQAVQASQRKSRQGSRPHNVKAQRRQPPPSPK